MIDLKLSEIKVMENLARSNPKVISLSQGGLKLGGAAKEIKDYVKEVLYSSKADYYGSAEGLLELREKIKSVINEKNGTADIKLSQIITTHGCDGALTNLFLMTLNEGDEVILPEPAYPAYAKIATIAKAKIIYTKPTSELQTSIDNIKEATTNKTKLIVFSNPSNPTGSIVNKEDLQTLVAWCEEKEIYLAIDEVYAYYIFDGDFQSAIAFVNDSQKLIVLNSFSKNFALSGWRIGYAVLPECLSDMFSIMQDALFIAPSLIGQYAGLAGLNNPQIVKRNYDYIKANRDITIEYLTPLKEKGIIDFNPPAAGFYVFIKTQEDGASLCLDLVKNAEISLVPGSSFGPYNKNYIRLCYARNRELLQEGLYRFIEYMEKKYV